MRRALAVAGTLLSVVVVAASASAAGQREQRQSALHLETVVSGLNAPIFVTAPRNEPGRLYVVEQGGLVKVVEKGKVRAAPFLDLTAKTRADGERGLLGLAFAPDYAKTRMLAVNYTDSDGNTRVVRYTSNGVRVNPASAKQLLFVKQPYPNHNGGMVAFGKDGLLYVGMGDGGAGGDPENRAQNPKELLGKILRLNASKPGSKPVIAALGVRNPWRFSFDRANGDLYIGDVGQESTEEVDYVKWPLGGLLNFGWDHYEAGTTYSDTPLGPGRLVGPVASYPHAQGCSISGGYVYRGTAMPAEKGRYFYGDYCDQTIWSLKITGGKAGAIRTEPFKVESLTSFGEDAAGNLYVVSGKGTIYRLAS